MKKFTSAVLAFAMLLSAMVCGASAADLDSSSVSPVSPTDFGELIQENVYYDEMLDAEVTERIYFAPNDSVTTLRGNYGNATITQTKTHRFNGLDYVTTTYASGHFVWGDGEVSVSEPTGGYCNLPRDVKISTEKVTSGTGKYAGVFNNYAYVTYTLKVITLTGGVQDLSVTVRVSENGNQI